MRNPFNQSREAANPNLILIENYISENEKKEILNYLSTLYPIWEDRFTQHHIAQTKDLQRSLLRPVYWLGNWQFACLNYYHPPKGIEHRCVAAETYPTPLQKIVLKIENQIRENFSQRDVPKRWHLNTCLINYYGDRFENEEWVDMARVGEHKDFEPGPVASISFGERALFQFVKSSGKNNQSKVVLQQWLNDRSLQLFGGEKFKNQLFHRVQRVEKKGIEFKNLNTSNFRTRRINFTFRYVPDDHVQPLSRFPQTLQQDVVRYVKKLSEHSEFWRNQIP
jgi:DNA oxidative demethylase